MSDVGNGSRVGSGLGSVPTTGSARSGRFYFLDRAIFLVQDGGPDGIVFLIDFFFLLCKLLRIFNPLIQRDPEIP